MSDIKKDDMQNMSVAPYNFVSLYETFIERYNSIDELPSHEKYEKDCLNGYIDYMIEAKSPIIISDGGQNSTGTHNKVNSFFKDQNGKYAIPGSTIRGLIRNNAQILGVGSIEGDIKDNLFLYRALADRNTKLRKDYLKAIDITPENKMPGRVKAGYIYMEGKDKYVIVPAKHIKGRTFYGIRETVLRNADKNNIGINYMYNKDIVKFKFNIRANKKSELQRWYNTLKDNVIDGFRYKPYSMKISYDAKFIDNGGINLSYIDRDDSSLPNKGYLLCSGFMQKKCTHYIINKIDMNGKKIILDIEEIRAYKEDLARKKYNKNDDRFLFYQLPEKPGIENSKPIFYTDEGKRNYFGFTPYLRIFYNNSTKKGIPQGLKKDGIDYTKSIFGFTSKDYSYKSRVSFEDAIIISEPIELTEASLILGEPKPTCYPDYLDQTNTSVENRKTYNDEDFKIRGIKQYWIKNKVINTTIGNNDKVAIKIKPLSSGTQFKGRIYFNNLHKDELGLLLWSLRLEKGCFLNIGLAKPYGYGKIELKDIKLKLENIDEKYSSLVFDFYNESDDIDEYIKIYKDYVKENYNIDLDNNVRGIREFFILKSVALSDNESRYMQIKNARKENEFAFRNALPTAYEIGREKESIYYRVDNEEKKQKKINEDNNAYNGEANKQVAITENRVVNKNSPNSKDGLDIHSDSRVKNDKKKNNNSVYEMSDEKHEVDLSILVNKFNKVATKSSSKTKK